MKALRNAIQAVKNLREQWNSLTTQQQVNSAQRTLQTVIDAEDDARTNEELVIEFHEKFKHPVHRVPNAGTKKLRHLRVALIAEELGELCDALRVALVMTKRNGEWVIDIEAYGEDNEVDLVEAADALGDIQYVTLGANAVFGFPGDAILREVHASNMSKLGADGNPIYNEHGKVLKGPYYRLPDIAKIINDATAANSAD
jgi:predicted HAD superfamily Cof-like phosphohydrolase